MKNWLTQILGLCTAVLLLSSCEKDEDQIVAKPGRDTALSAAVTNVPLTLDDADKTYVVYSWTPVTFGFLGEVVSYSLEVDKKGNEFAAPTVFATGSSPTKTLTVAEVNTIMIDKGAVLNEETGEYSSVELEVRAKAYLGTTPSANALAKYSPVTALSGTPYNSNAAIVYPSLWVPGAYQSWTPATAPIIASGDKANTSTFEGYVNITGAELAFKFTSVPAWDGGTNYGKGTATGDLSTDAGAGNLEVLEPGFYWLKANTETLKWSATKTTWSAIGSATANGWASDTPMTYDAATGVWTLTTNLSVGGEMKFRANNDWAINYGDRGADGLLDFDGDNIQVEEAGSYTITLDLSKGAGNYGYTLTKN